MRKHHHCVYTSNFITHDNLNALSDRLPARTHEDSIEQPGEELPGSRVVASRDQPAGPRHPATNPQVLAILFPITRTSSAPVLRTQSSCPLQSRRRNRRQRARVQAQPRPERSHRVDEPWACANHDRALVMCPSMECATRVFAPNAPASGPLPLVRRRAASSPGS